MTTKSKWVVHNKRVLKDANPKQSQTMDLKWNLTNFRKFTKLLLAPYDNMTVWILAGNDIIFSTAAGLIRLRTPVVKWSHV